MNCGRLGLGLISARVTTYFGEGKHFTECSLVVVLSLASWSPKWHLRVVTCVFSSSWNYIDELANTGLLVSRTFAVPQSIQLYLHLVDAVLSIYAVILQHQHRSLPYRCIETLKCQTRELPIAPRH